jgi:hypothetical protein
MTTKTTLAELLRWRLAQAEQEAPPAPRAARLLELARPWWETYPEKFSALAGQLASLRMGYGHAMVDAGAVPNLAPIVPALVIEMDTINESRVQLLYFDVTDSRLRMRFELEVVPASLAAGMEATFVAESDLRPLFTAVARAPMTNEYWLEAALPAGLGREWETLKVTGRMPFRLLFRPRAESE